MSMKLQPIRQAQATPVIPIRGTRRYTKTTRKVIWISVETSVIDIFPIPLKNPWIPLVNAGIR